MPLESVRIFEPCPLCRHRIDVTDMEPFTLTSCGGCSQMVRMRLTFDHFRIERELGIGGMSLVFEASDTALQRPVALKILNRDCLADSVRMAQFEREARITATFSHPHIVKVYSVGHDQGCFYIAMELVPGGSLDERIRVRGALPEVEVLSVALQVAQGLKAANEARLIHRDIKPGNILFAEDGAAKLVDFGLALATREKDESKEIWATPFYVPPEKLYDEPDTAFGDMYSLGATLYHALSGQPPIAKDTNSIEELKRLKSATVKLALSAPTISEETCAIIDRLCSRHPEQRYPNYEALIEHLLYAQKCLLVRGRKTSGAEARRYHRYRVWGSAAAVIIGVLGYSLSRRSSSPSSVAGPVISTATSVETADSVAPKFLEARESLLKGDRTAAKAAFEAIRARPDVPAPTRQWVAYHLGLIALMEGSIPTSQQIFKAMAEGRDWVQSADDTIAADLFAKLAGILSVGSTLSQQDVESFAPGSAEMVALLPIGLRAAQEGEPALARAALEAFQKASAPSSVAWAERYKPLAQKALEASQASLSLRWPDEKTPIQEATALCDKAQTTIASLAEWPKLKENYEHLLQEARERIKTQKQQAQDHQRQAENEATERDREVLTTLGKSLGQVMAGWNFRKGVEAVKAAKVATEQGRLMQADLLWLCENAELFLEGLAADVSKKTWSGDVQAVNGVSPRSSITKATRQKWTIRTPSREVIVEPTMLRPVFLLQMADDYLKGVNDPMERNRRRVANLAFAQLSGSSAEKDTLLQALVQEDPSLSARWQRLGALGAL